LRLIALIVLCGAGVITALLAARAASTQQLAISTVKEGSTETIGDQTYTMPPEIAVVKPPDMSLSRFRDLRHRVVLKIRANQRYKAFNHRAHPRRYAAAVSPSRRDENLALWRSRLEAVRAREGKWWSPWAYYGIPASIRSAFLCIHGGEGAWNSNTGNGYYGGLQMDYSFMTSYGLRAIRRWNGYAHRWPPRVQIIVADIARRSGRGFYPWPTTARNCGLI
jgi:hypothetical protein